MFGFGWLDGFRETRMSDFQANHPGNFWRGGGLFPNFCTRVCQRGLRTHTLSLAKFAKKTPFLYTPVPPDPEMRTPNPNFRELLPINSFPAQKHTLSLAFLSKKHTLSLTFLVKITPLMLAHSRYCIYSECPPPGLLENISAKHLQIQKI